MGNQGVINGNSFKMTQNLNFENSHITLLHQIENGTLVKFESKNQSLLSQNKDEKQDNCISSYYLQKIIVTDSQEQFKLLSKYLENQSLFDFHHQPSEILKIVKIYEQAERGFCSNHYVIQVLFQYSDITIRDQLRIRSMKKQKAEGNDHRTYFQYNDLCSIMFACISSLYAVEKMEENFKNFIKKHTKDRQLSFKHIDCIAQQYKLSIPFNLDRIIIMPDGTIKLMHPLVLDHNNRTHFSDKFFYSPQKMKDFFLNDGIKGRLFQAALIVLECALLENNQQMKQIYNGYCINENVLNEKIQNAIQIYSQLENLSREDLKLFKMIKKMTKIDTQQRIGLQQSIKEAQDLFQLNKKLKESISSNIYKQKLKDPQERMSIEELQFIPSYRMTLKSSPMQNSTAHNTACANSKFNKTTSRQTCVRETLKKEEGQNPQIQITNFDQNHQVQKNKSKNFQSTSKNPFGSLLINNDHQNFFKTNNDECFQSLFAHESNFYETRKQSFLQSKFQYGKFYCNPINNRIIEEKHDLRNSSGKKSLSSLYGRQIQYKKVLQQSIKNSSKERQSFHFHPKFIKQNLLRSKTKKSQNSAITASKFMDNDKIYLKYDFIEKSDEKLMNMDDRYSFMDVKDCKNGDNQEQYMYSKQIFISPYKFEQQYSQKQANIKSENQCLNSVTNSSEVLQKLTSVHINQRLQRHRILH